MIYDVTLAIGYDYPGEVKDARHVLRVRPRHGDGQRVVSTRLAISPKPDETIAEKDFFGNALDHVLILPPHEALSVTMKARVSVSRAPLALEETPSVADVVAWSAASREAGPAGPMHFLGDSRIARRTEELTAYAAESVDLDAPIGVAMIALSKRIQDEFDYAPGATDVHTPIETVFAERKGVCQDFAHLMIASLRGAGLPAAYISGFIRTIPPEGKPRLEGADAMHAWVAVWLGPKLGWRGFDPTNGCMALNDHIVVAMGRDYSDVAPIDGVLITAGPQKTEHKVDVVPVG